MLLKILEYIQAAWFKMEAPLIERVSCVHVNNKPLHAWHVVL